MIVCFSFWATPLSLILVSFNNIPGQLHSGAPTQNKDIWPSALLNQHSSEGNAFIPIVCIVTSIHLWKLPFTDLQLTHCVIRVSGLWVAGEIFNGLSRQYLKHNLAETKHISLRCASSYTSQTRYCHHHSPRYAVKLFAHVVSFMSVVSMIERWWFNPVWVMDLSENSIKVSLWWSHMWVSQFSQLLCSGIELLRLHPACASEGLFPDNHSRNTRAQQLLGDQGLFWWVI